MITNGFSSADSPSPRQRRVLRLARMSFLLLLCALLIPTAAQEAPEERGSAMVAVYTDLLSERSDKISIRLVNRNDKAMLTEIITALGAKFNAAPEKLTFQRGDPQLMAEDDLGADFYLPVVPRGERVLPIAPFIETFAPYASQLRIVFIVQGPFTYQGYQKYEHPDVSFTVDPPDTNAAKLGVPLAFYGVNVTIRNPSLTSASLPSNTERRHAQRGRLPVYLWLLFAGVAGALAGVLLSRMLTRWKASMAGTENNPSTGGDHDRT